MFGTNKVVSKIAIVEGDDALEIKAIPSNTIAKNKWKKTAPKSKYLIRIKRARKKEMIVIWIS